MGRKAVLGLALGATSLGLMGCGGGGGGGGPTPAPTPATPTPAPTPPGPPPTTTTTTPGPESIPNPFCGKSDLSTPRVAIPPVGQPIGWNPTGAKVGPSQWCQAEVPATDFNLKDYCGTSNLQANGTMKAEDGPEVKVLTYNLYWWNLYGQRHGNQNSAPKNMAAFAKDKPYDLFGFQECEDINLVTQGMKDAGINTQYTTWAIGESYVNVCMGYASDVFTEISRGREFVAEDQVGKFHYGKRVVQWIRLKHKASGKMVFFINHHGPTPPNTGGMCGSKATAYQLVKQISSNAHVGDSVIFIGDFNAPMQMNMNQGKGNEWQTEAGVIACHIPHVFAVPTPEAMWGVDNFYSTCTKMKQSTQMERGGSDHFALNAVFELTGATAADAESTMVV